MNTAIRKREVFKAIPGYEGIYEVSNLGNVKSCARKINNGSREIKLKERILNPIDWNGYKKVRLYKNKCFITTKVHRLVMLSFVGYSNQTVDHIDGNPSNNELDNLRYCSQRMNNIYAKMRTNKTSKYIGVSFSKHSGLWRSCIKINGKLVHLGYSKTEEEASKFYQDKLKEVENAI